MRKTNARYYLPREGSGGGGGGFGDGGEEKKRKSTKTFLKYFIFNFSC